MSEKLVESIAFFVTLNIDFFEPVLFLTPVQKI